MVDKATNCVVVFNGEIYNFRELRQTLQRVGHVFRSDGDTEVLLRGYLHWGDAVLTRLRGMFAFALWDARLQTLLLVRDPYGIKPLYYTDQCGCCAFASQVRPLREHFVPDNEPDPAGLVGFLLLGSVPEPYSSYRAIRAVPAGYVVRISSSGCALPVPYASVGKVWADAAERPERLGAVALLERVRSAVRGSVSAHRVADVPVGAFLSAGIDSGAVVGLMAEDSSAVVQTVTLGFRDFQGGAQNEVFHAEEVALRYGTRQ